MRAATTPKTEAATLGSHTIEDYSSLIGGT